MCIYQPSFFDESERLSALSQLRDPLEALSRYIEFEVFRPELAAVLARSAEPVAVRKPYDVLLMFNILILQRLFNLSDEQTEYQLTDRLSFTRFLGLRLGSEIPDLTTVWRFRESLTTGRVVKRLFNQFNAQLAKQSLLTKAGVIVNASIVEVPRQRNTREENAELKAGQTPAAGTEQPRKLAQKDVDARLDQGGETFYGYKDHVRTDAGTMLITDCVVTPATVHDSQALAELVGLQDRGQSLWEDSAYKSAATDAQLQRWGADNQIHEKGTRGADISAAQKTHNRQKSKIRRLVEHIVGYIENSMHDPELEYIGLARISTGIGLVNLTYNLCRYVRLIRLGRVPAMA